MCERYWEVDIMAQPVRARRLTDEEGRRLVRIVRRGTHSSVRSAAPWSSWRPRVGTRCRRWGLPHQR